MISKFITYPFVTDAQDLMARGFNYLKAKWPTWQPAEGNLDVAIIEAVADQQADVATGATMVPKAIMRKVGELFQFPAKDAISALATSTWYLTDTIGHTIPAGAQVAIADSHGNLLPFQVLVDVAVPPGSNVTAVGQVQLIAALPGVNASGIGSVGGVVQLYDTYAWVDHITQATVTYGGQDAESDDDYLNRLAVELSTISPRPILAQDFGILARNVSGVQRAVAIDGYNPADGTTTNQRMVTIFAVDMNGQPVNGTVKTAISTYLAAMREVNFIVNTADPTMHEIDVAVNVKKVLSYNSTDVANRVQLIIQQFLDPSTWGITPTDDPNNPLTWSNQTIIRYLELAHQIANISGVDYIASLTFGLHGGTKGTTDLTLTGTVPLPFVNVPDIAVTVS